LKGTKRSFSRRGSSSLGPKKRSRNSRNGLPFEGGEKPPRRKRSKKGPPGSTTPLEARKKPLEEKPCQASRSRGETRGRQPAAKKADRGDSESGILRKSNEKKRAALRKGGNRLFKGSMSEARIQDRKLALRGEKVNRLQKKFSGMKNDHGGRTTATLPGCGKSVLSGGGNEASVRGRKNHAPVFPGKTFGLI